MRPQAERTTRVTMIVGHQMEAWSVPHTNFSQLGTLKERDACLNWSAAWSTVRCLSCDGADISTEHDAVFALENSEFYWQRMVTLMFFIQNNSHITDVIGFSFELLNSFFHWIACKIARTSTSLPIKWKFKLSDFKLSRLDLVPQEITLGNLIFVSSILCKLDQNEMLSNSISNHDTHLIFFKSIKGNWFILESAPDYLALWLAGSTVTFMCAGCRKMSLKD